MPNPVLGGMVAFGSETINERRWTIAPAYRKVGVQLAIAVESGEGRLGDLRLCEDWIHK